MFLSKNVLERGKLNQQNCVACKELYWFYDNHKLEKCVKKNPTYLIIKYLQCTKWM